MAQEPLQCGDELCLNMLTFPGFLTDTFIATLGLIKRRRANAESVIENYRLQGYTSPKWLQRCLLQKYPLNFEDICARRTLDTVRLLQLVSQHSGDGPHSVFLRSRIGLNNGAGEAVTDADSLETAGSPLSSFMQWCIPHDSPVRSEIETLLAGEASLPLCGCTNSLKLRKVALKLLRLPESYAHLPPHVLGPLLESHWVVVDAGPDDESPGIMQRLLRATDCCRSCYKSHPVALAFPNMGWRDATATD